MSINSVTLGGNLTRDMECSTTPGGMSVGKFGLAVNERRKNAQGAWEDVPMYFGCTLFGNRVASLQPYLLKGTKVTVQGRLRYESWTAQDGTKRSKVSVIADELEFMSRRDDGGQRRQPAQQADAYADDDIPF